MATFEDAEGARDWAWSELTRCYPEVSGIGITRVGEGWGLKVNLSKPMTKKLPGHLDGIPILTEVVGKVVAG